MSHKSGQIFQNGPLKPILHKFRGSNRASQSTACKTGSCSSWLCPCLSKTSCIRSLSQEKKKVKNFSGLKEKGGAERSRLRWPQAPVTWGVADVGQWRANHWKSQLELETLATGVLARCYTQTKSTETKKPNMYMWREVTQLDGLVSHHQSCMNSAVDLSPANGVKHTVRSLPCVHHETSVFSVCCIIKKSHEAVVGHSCSPHSIPSPCSPSSSTRSFFFMHQVSRCWAEWTQ